MTRDQYPTSNVYKVIAEDYTWWATPANVMMNGLSSWDGLLNLNKLSSQDKKFENNDNAANKNRHVHFATFPYVIEIPARVDVNDNDCFTSDSQSDDDDDDDDEGIWDIEENSVYLEENNNYDYGNMLIYSAKSFILHPHPTCLCLSTLWENIVNGPDVHINIDVGLGLLLL